MMWFKIQNHQVLLNIFVKPNAKKTALIAITDNQLQISLHAKPHQGEANKELISYLAKLFRLPKSYITLEGGERSRDKKVRLELTNKVQQFLDNPSKFID